MIKRVLKKGVKNVGRPATENERMNEREVRRFENVGSLQLMM